MLDASETKGRFAKNGDYETRFQSQIRITYTIFSFTVIKNSKNTERNMKIDYFALFLQWSQMQREAIPPMEISK